MTEPELTIDVWELADSHEPSMMLVYTSDPETEVTRGTSPKLYGPWGGNPAGGSSLISDQQAYDYLVDDQTIGLEQNGDGPFELTWVERP